MYRSYKISANAKVVLETIYVLSLPFLGCSKLRPTPQSPPYSAMKNENFILS